MSILGFDMNQNGLAVPAWDLAMDRERPARVIELGSYNGGFAIALAFAGHLRGVKIHSFDTMEAPKEEWRHLANYLMVSFYRSDVFKDQELIGAMIKRTGKTFLLCDNGDKKREFKTFAPYLKSGDVIAAHDFGNWDKSEIDISDVRNTVYELKLERFMELEMSPAWWLAYRKI